MEWAGNHQRVASGAWNCFGFFFQAITKVCFTALTKQPVCQKGKKQMRRHLRLDSVSEMTPQTTYDYVLQRFGRSSCRCVLWFPLLLQSEKSPICNFWPFARHRTVTLKKKQKPNSGANSAAGLRYSTMFCFFKLLSKSRKAQNIAAAMTQGRLVSLYMQACEGA